MPKLKLFTLTGGTRRVRMVFGKIGSHFGLLYLGCYE